MNERRKFEVAAWESSDFAIVMEKRGALVMRCGSEIGEAAEKARKDLKDGRSGVGGRRWRTWRLEWYQSGYIRNQEPKDILKRKSQLQSSVVKIKRATYNLSAVCSQKSCFGCPVIGSVKSGFFCSQVMNLTCI
jgi:hypothetical protein